MPAATRIASTCFIPILTQSQPNSNTITELWGKNGRKMKKMTIASISISPFEGFGIKNEAKEVSREAIHEAIDGWIDE